MNRKAIVVITATTCTLGAFAWAGWAQRTKEQNHRAFRAAIEAPKRSDVSNAQHVEQIWAAAEKVEGAEPKREAARVGLEIAYQAASSEGPGEAGAILESVSQRIEADSSLTEDTQAQAIREQADYQAAVAAQMGGDMARAKQLLKSFLQEYPQTPFVNSVYRRLHDLADSDQERETLDIERQKKYEEQQARLALRLAECGPRALHRWLEMRSRNAPSIETLVQEAGLTLEGASMADLQRVAAKHGLRLEGHALNRPDFERQSTPFMWLQGAHYVLVLKRSQGNFTIFDPMTGQDRDITLGEPNGKPETYYILKRKN
ncbi:MAG TPA: cysteine peptidase family C39 domain-containing protein [Fimbriimonadaceae bacterium]|nr:hypothetical protein [Armatimonadota bacterium]HRI73220.1 cysteine peptidase family C39 domain-containing protein [Fimbriimonadaceae bacterium]